MMRSKMVNLLATVAMLAASAPAGAQITTASVSGGRVEGNAAGSIGVFKGIPFAAPPVGTLRWAAPRPVSPWAGTRVTTEFAPPCMQDQAMISMMGVTAAPSEDCLYLNVWTPAKRAGEKLPVMVWIYGGGFAGGLTGSPVYDGAHLASKGVVLVSIAYRLGALGFLAHRELSAESGHGSGTYGLMDQIAGLEWVKSNIAEFGGDPGNVTIFGESAGGIAVSMLAASPRAKGLFQKAISESGGSFAPASTGNGGIKTLAAAEAQGAGLFASIGAPDLAAARAIPADKILKVPGASAMGGFWPPFDGYVLLGDQYKLYSEGRFNDTPVLIGTNSNEGGMFVRGPITSAQFEQQVRAQYAASADRILAAYPHATDAEALRSTRGLFRENTFAWPTYAWAKLQTEKGRNPAFVYYFDIRNADQPDGSNHASEIPYVFGNLDQPTIGGSKPDPATSAQRAGYWTNFAKTGNPNGPGLPDWPAFAKRQPRVLVIGTDPGVKPVQNFTQVEAVDAYYADLRNAAKADTPR